MIKDKEIVEIRLSRDEDYYSQRNNEYSEEGVNQAMVLCQCTSYINALSNNGVSPESLIPNGSPYTQPEDYFASLFEKPDIIAYANKIAPGYDGPIREIHDVLAYTCNKYLLKDHTMKATFSTDVSIDRCFDSIVNRKKSFVASGVFCGFGHVVSVSGIKYDHNRIWDKDKGIISFYIDDPYGDYQSDYKITKGNDIEMPFEDFMTIIKTRGGDKKWIHLFS